MGIAEASSPIIGARLKARTGVREGAELKRERNTFTLELSTCAYIHSCALLNAHIIGKRRGRRVGRNLLLNCTSTLRHTRERELAGVCAGSAVRT